MKTYAEQVAALEATIAAKKTRMEEVMKKSLEEGRTSDEVEAEEFDTIEGELKKLDGDLVRLKKLADMQVSSAKPVEGKSTETASASRSLGVQVKNTQKLDKGIAFARYAMCKLAAKGNPHMASELAKAHYPENEGIVKTLEFEARGGKVETIMKATVEAGTTLDATFAGPLVQYQDFAGDFVEFLRNRTIIGQFGQAGIPGLRRVPFNMRVAGQTSGGAAQWVGEGAPKPLTQFDFSTQTLRFTKVAAISVLTNETIRFSSPSAEALVRDGLAGAVIERIDTDFILPSKAAVADVSPASITNGATTFVSSGNTEAAIRADLAKLWGSFIAARNAPRDAVYIMPTMVALQLSLMLNPLGQQSFPGITLNGGTMNGVPVIVSDYVPYSSAGAVVVLANASDIWLADDGQVTVDASQEASLQMLDNPTNNSATGTPTTMVSMFQTNSTAFRAERFINWARRRSSAVAYLTGVNWGE